MIPKLDENGQPVLLDRPDKNSGKTVKEERVEMQTFSEFYISDKKDIETFIELFGINASSFDYKPFLEVEVKDTKVSPIIVA